MSTGVRVEARLVEVVRELAVVVGGGGVGGVRRGSHVGGVQVRGSLFLYGVALLTLDESSMLILRK